MRLIARLKRELRYLKGLRRLSQRIKPITLESPDLVCDDFEEAVDRWPDRVAVIDEQRQLTYRELDMLANRFGHWAKGRNLRRGDTVALVLPNRIEFLAAWMGFTKVGVAAALVNNQLTGAALAHSLAISKAHHIIADTETWQAVEAASGKLDKAVMIWVLDLPDSQEASARRNLDKAIKSASGVRPDRSVRSGLTNRDIALYIYTSGTTGLPKAARISHSRARLYMRAFAGATGTTAEDRVYCVLPLYHSTGGLCGVGTALLNGAALILRRKFSATQFWPDVVATGATRFVYIGELCRYLVGQPEHPMERDHRLKLAFGNGLRPEVWTEFQKRFAIPEILEFYGSTEGNASIFNFDGKPGAIGRIPGYVRNRLNLRLVRFDLDAGEPIRGANSLCQECRPGEIGEAIGMIGSEARLEYSGYADKAASEQKVLRDVFKKGDAWFRTGDLMRQDRDGYFYFVDRIGDTYRWKGENVSTTEVAERLAEAPGVAEAIVYGVPTPGAEGKAGMACIVASGRFNAKLFGAYVDEQLAPYARPVFLRLKKDLQTTGTFKYRKVDLVAEGFDPSKITDQLYVRDPKGAYVRLKPERYAEIMAGEAKL
ncbi:long-chain-acyl-CoA synthetase [Brevundimonas sp.]|uniref:long-chain-acyl-CoA synthetase n=1 Tax=Brevundimonas sp. TaxID=1871086 RepID=UPI0025DF4DF7|nr:long-chain-acyl-CoA synthetase [Brevundimonas sp.]